jgi:PAS domain S-box-containing protein
MGWLEVRAREMRIKTKLLLSFALAASGVLLAGASGAWPLRQVWLADASGATPPPEAFLLAAKMAAMATGLAALVTIVVGFIAARSVGNRLARFRREAEALLNGRGEGIKVQDTEDLDQTGVLFNELHARVLTLEARQVNEEELMAAKRYADNVINSMFDVLIVTDPELHIQRVNKAACELLEYTELELVGRPVESLFKEEPTFLGPPITELLKSNQMRDFEATYRTRSGRLISVLLSASTMRDNAGRPLAIITVGKDITARKQIERELLEAKATAEAASRAKSAFVANMSHEIRTPMTAILGYADLLAHPSQTEEERRRCMQTIRRNGEHLLAVINDILDVSKIEAGKMTVEKIACTPCQLVADVAALMKGRAQQKNLSFDVRYIGAIPQTIQSDPTRLRQILMNLIGNAIKFTTKGNVRLLVSLTDPVDAPNPRLRFDVIDTGVGLNTQQQDSLFRPFAQADSSTTRKFGGTGLGLTISKRLSVMLGGDLVCKSELGEGSTFSLTVQTGSLRDVTMLDNPKALVDAAEAPTHGNDSLKLEGRVLLAEDGPDNRVLITFYLRQAGIDVTEVENGLMARDRALEALKKGNPFDLILMDMQMPELDGYGATTALRKAGYRAPIVALTAHALGGDKEKCLAAGCDDFAVKPIDHEAFVAVLKKFLPEKAGTTAASQTDPRPTAVLATSVASSSTPSAPTTPPTPALAPTPGSSPDSTLSKLLSKPGTAKLVERFLAGLPQRVGAIHAAVAGGDTAQVKILSHQLKGAAGGYGFTAVSQAAAQLEAAVTQGADTAALTQHVNTLATLCASIRGAAA